ncbi:MAG: glycosyltransferase [Nitrospinota bacterium]
MKVRTLVIAASLGGGGAERVITTLLRNLDRRRFDLHLALVDASGPYLSRIPPDVTVHDLRARRVRYALLPILRLVRRLQPSVALSTLGYLNLAVIAARPLWPAGTRLWVREANIPSASLPEAPRSRLLQWLYPRLYPRADGIVCASEGIRDDLVDGFRIPPAKTKVIVNPVDTEAIRHQTGQDESPLPGAGPHLVAAGRLTRQKGFDLLLRAVSPLIHQRRQIHLTILGAGPEKTALGRLAESLKISDSVSMPGFVDNPYSYFRAADLFILSSRWEGLPNVVLEALACGTPVVGFDCSGGGVREIARETEEVVLVPPNDVPTLTVAIRENLERKNASSSPPLLPARFQIESVVKRYEEVLLGEGLSWTEDTGFKRMVRPEGFSGR